MKTSISLEWLLAAILCFLLLSQIPHASADNDDDDDDEETARPDPYTNAVAYDMAAFDRDYDNKPMLLMFSAPWCGFCLRLAPTWDQLAKKYNTPDSGVVIGKVDCTKNEKLCEKAEAYGFPTLKFFSKSAPQSGAEYKGKKTMETLEAFLKSNMARKGDAERKAPTPAPVDEDEDKDESKKDEL